MGRGVIILLLHWKITVSLQPNIQWTRNQYVNLSLSILDQLKKPEHSICLGVIIVAQPSSRAPFFICEINIFGDFCQFLTMLVLLLGITATQMAACKWGLPANKRCGVLDQAWKMLKAVQTVLADILSKITPFWGLFVSNILFFWLRMEGEELKIEKCSRIKEIWGTRMENEAFRIKNWREKAMNWG